MSCQNSHTGQPKIRHATREAALDHVKAVLARNHRDGTPERSVGLAPYPCETCGGWHIGHSQTSPLVWHYTVGAKIDAILDSGYLRPAKARRQAGEPEPLLWFSRNAQWERSVIKVAVRDRRTGRNAMVRIGRMPISHGSMALQEMVGAGLYRLGVPAAYAKLRWSDYLARNPTPPALRDAMARCGNPTEWLATDERVPLTVVLDHARRPGGGIQRYMGGVWCPAETDEDDARFERYLAQRGRAYEAAAESLYAKLMQARQDAPPGESYMPVSLSEPEAVLWSDLEFDESGRLVDVLGPIRRANPQLT